MWICEVNVDEIWTKTIDMDTWIKMWKAMWIWNDWIEFWIWLLVYISCYEIIIWNGTLDINTWNVNGKW